MTSKVIIALGLCIYHHLFQCGMTKNINNVDLKVIARNFLKQPQMMVVNVDQKLTVLFLNIQRTNHGQVGGGGFVNPSGGSGSVSGNRQG